jgi:hypothetical protein
MQHACNIGWCQLLLPFVNGGPFHQFLHLSTFNMVQWEVLWSGWLFGEWWHHEKLCCAARCSNLQNHSAVMDLMICHSRCQIPHSMISSFVVFPCGFYSKLYSKGLQWNIKIWEQWMHWVSIRWSTAILFKSIF